MAAGGSEARGGMTYSKTGICEDKAATYTIRQPHCREQDW